MDLDVHVVGLQLMQWNRAELDKTSGNTIYTLKKSRKLRCIKVAILLPLNYQYIGKRQRPLRPEHALYNYVQLDLMYKQIDGVCIPKKPSETNSIYSITNMHKSGAF